MRCGQAAADTQAYAGEVEQEEMDDGYRAAEGESKDSCWNRGLTKREEGK